MWQGYFTALITPMRDGQVDWASLERMIEWQIQQGVSGIVACGTTGESLTLAFAEQKGILSTCVRIANGRVPIIAGVGCVRTDETIQLAQQAESIGVDGLLVVAPAYIRPTEEGLFHHYHAIHHAVDLPIIVYNNPVRSAVNFSLEFLARLRELPRFIGIKDAADDLSRPTKIRRALGADFIQFSGNDATIVGYLAEGGHGCISVTSNVVPQVCTALYQHWLKGDRPRVSDLRDALAPLHEALFVEPNPVPVKYAASLLGLCSDEVRVPLAALSAHHRPNVARALHTLSPANDAAA